MTTSAPKDLRASLVAIGSANIEAKKDASLDELVSSFAHTQVLFDNGSIPVKVAAILAMLLNDLNDEDTRAEALNRLSSGANMIDEDIALRFLLNRSSYSVGQKRAIGRITVKPGDPGYSEQIAVDSTGTPTGLADLQRENDRLQALADGSDGDTSEEDLKNARIEALAPIKAVLPTLQGIADDWATVGYFLPGRKKQKSPNDTVRREFKRSDLETLQADVVKITKAVEEA